MRPQDDRVPAAVEDYLIGLSGQAGQLGGSIGGAVGGGIPGSAGGGRGGARGATRAAARMRTVVEDRTLPRPYVRPDSLARIAVAFPKYIALPSSELVLRIAIPIGMTGLQQVVVDIAPSGADSPRASGTTVRAYGKEGLLSRKPTARTADQIVSVLSS